MNEQIDDLVFILRGLKVQAANPDYNALRFGFGVAASPAVNAHPFGFEVPVIPDWLVLCISGFVSDDYPGAPAIHVRLSPSAYGTCQHREETSPCEASNLGISCHCGLGI